MGAMNRKNRVSLFSWVLSVTMITSLCVAGLAGVAPQTQTLTRDAGQHGSSRSALEIYARDITKLARDGRLSPSKGHNEEINQAINVLSRRNRNNPILVGESRSGHAAVVKGIALKIAKGEAPENLRDKQIYSLNLTTLLAGN